MKKNKSKIYSRRNFLGTAACAAIGSTTFFSTLFNLQSISAASMSSSLRLNQSSDDYKALVCILLAGGNDSYNMIIPTDNEHYTEYHTTRNNIAIAQSSILNLSPITYNEKELGFHPAMPELKNLFDQGKLAIINNVGTLLQPTTKTQYNNSINLPFSLYSHDDQEHQWQTSIPQTKSSTGWAGRLADLVHAANSNQDISMNISLSGKNIFQVGQNITEFSILNTGNGSKGIRGYDNSGSINGFDLVRTFAINRLMDQQYQDVFKKTYADIVRTSQHAHEIFSAAMSSSTLTTNFSETELSQSLKMVARTIKARQTLGMSKQTFFIRYDGWDHHDEVLVHQNNMFGVLSKALSEFQTALEEINIEDSVTTFTISDFARTLTSNGNGTDHAWGGNVLVVGNQVNGKDIYGSYPSLALNADLVLNGGILIPQISTDEYFAELALWYGVAKSDLVYLFPNIGNFYNPMSIEAPIGFMNM